MLPISLTSERSVYYTAIDEMNKTQGAKIDQHILLKLY